MNTDIVKYLLIFAVFCLLLLFDYWQGVGR